MSSTLASFQEAAKTAALGVIAKSPETLKNLQAAFQQHFAIGPPSAVQKKFSEATDVTAKNEVLSSALLTTLDAADAALNDIAVLEQYIHLTIPMMEDGNNFGVTVQLAAIKTMEEFKEKLNKGTEELSKYASARADAMEKCKLPSKSTVTTSTTSQSTTDGKDKEKGEIKSSDQKTATEEKKTETTMETAEIGYRREAVLAVDVFFYAKAKSVLQTATTAYMAAVDYVDKNKEKIAAPKGSRESGSVYQSMY